MIRETDVEIINEIKNLSNIVWIEIGIQYKIKEYPVTPPTHKFWIKKK